jgi:hypothetical protein
VLNVFTLMMEAQHMRASQWMHIDKDNLDPC